MSPDAEDSLQPKQEDDGPGSIGGYVVFPHPGPLPIPDTLNPPSSTYSVSQSHSREREDPSLSLRHLQHLSSSTSSTCPPPPPASLLPTSSICPPPHPATVLTIPTPVSPPTGRGRRDCWLSCPHRLGGVNCITVKRHDEPRCLPGQEHAGEDGLLSRIL